MNLLLLAIAPICAILLYICVQDNEFHQVYIAELTVPLNALVKQESEVEALKLVTLKDFIDLLKDSKTNMHFVASNYDYYLKVHEAIQNKLLKL
ncbi:NUDIX hydrolase [Winogradskyella thalassocola]|uniref:Uncharacterized protein n=1 Tax=Winogradskyella thalassocola TaxID=262004 RepID=A0A1G8J0V2_9FLAO|nr:hypothetical protein [Winogradskyella thalassocola]SDI24703.1 hypothetical protein SAMN04489796_108139 [Winogradskyella thalassocola]